MYLWASGQVVRALDCCAKHRWFEPNPRIIVWMLAHCSPSSKWAPGGNTGEVKGGEERNWPPYLTMPEPQDKCPSNRHSPNVRNRIRDSPLPFYIYIYMYMYIKDVSFQIINRAFGEFRHREGFWHFMLDSFLRQKD